MTISSRLREGADLLEAIPLNRYSNGAGDSRASMNPARGQELVRLTDGLRADVDNSVETAQRAFKEWAAATPRDRAMVMLNLASKLEEHRTALGQLESLNTGKPLEAAIGEMDQAADTIRFFAGAARTLTAPAPGRYTTSHTSLVIREPLGIVAGIVPWNYPLMMAVWKLAPAIAAGNCVVLKPSELTPLSLLAFLELARGVLPEGVVNVVLGTGEEVGRALAGHPTISMISLTGSVRAGRSVSSDASESLKRVHLELGGKAPVLLFEDADIDTAASTIATMGFWNAGQECGAATRVFAHHSIHDQVVEALTERAEKTSVGDPSEEETDIGPLISEDHRHRVHGFVERAITDGARATHGRGPLDRPGYYYSPTVLTEVQEGSYIDQVEIFGPVITVTEFGDEDEVVRRANESPYGLSASVWTKDLARALNVSHQLDSGTVWVNDHLALATEMPWGGYKVSGTGRDLSVLGLEEYTRTKHVMIGTTL